MKKLPFLFANALAALTLASCANNSAPTSVPTSAPVVKTAEEVMVDWVVAFFEIDRSEASEYYENDSGDYYSGASFGKYGEEYLEDAVAEGVAYVPTYCEMLEDIYLDKWDDGSNGAFAIYGYGDNYLEFGSYVESGELFLQLCVYEWVE